MRYERLPISVDRRKAPRPIPSASSFEKTEGGPDRSRGRRPFAAAPYNWPRCRPLFDSFLAMP